MVVKVPKLDSRGVEELLKQFKSLIPYYTPEWQLAGKTADEALVRIYINLLKGILQQWNQVPEKHFISFLDRIGIKRMPAQPAFVPITFVLAEGALEHVHIPAGTGLASGEVLFETEKSILAAPAKILDAYSVNVSSDEIYEMPAYLFSGDPVLPYETTLLYTAKAGESEFFVKDSEGFKKGDLLQVGPYGYVVVSDIKENKIILAQKMGKEDFYYSQLPTIAVRGVGEKLAVMLSDRNIKTVDNLLEYKTDVYRLASLIGEESKPAAYLEKSRRILENAEMGFLDKTYEVKVNQLVASRSYLYFDYLSYLPGKPVKKVTELELFAGENIQDHIFYLGHKDLFNIKEGAEIEINITLLNNVWPNKAFMQWEYWGEKTGGNGDEDKTSDWFAFGDNNVAFSDNKIVLRKLGKIEIKEREINGIKSRWIRCKVRKNKISNVKGMSIKSLDLGVKPYQGSSAGAKEMTADMAFHNDIPLDLTYESQQYKTDIYPFGKFPGLYDTLYIGSQEAFSKKNLTLKIAFDLSKSGEPGDEGVTLSWEYWNGSGWDVIPDLQDSTQGFTKSDHQVTFCCPGDIEATAVNGQENFWIRTRIIQGGYGQGVFVPYQEDVFIYYDKNYPTSWGNRNISERLAKKIENALKALGVKVRIGGAQELKIYMETKNNGIVVMAMDVAPDTVYDGKAQSLVKSWLASGGKIIWIGDWEFFYYGTAKGIKTRVNENGAKRVLGISTSITEAKTAEMTGASLGKTIIPGFQQFSSKRPAIISKMEAQGLVFEVYGADKDKKYADPVLITKPRPRFGALVKFHMEDIDEAEDITEKETSIAREVGQFIKNRFFTAASALSQINPPAIRWMSIEYQAPENSVIDIEHGIIYNNLQYNDVTDEIKNSGKTLSPFRALDDDFNTFYMAFDKKIEKGPISIFFWLEEQLVTLEKMPRIQWQYYSQTGTWKSCNVVDQTRGLTRTGVMEFVFPLDFQKSGLFGQEAYWIRAVISKNRELLVKIKGIFLNTTRALQAETVKDEIAGSGDGTENQTFTLTKIPVISEEIQVNEIDTIPRDEQENIKKNKEYGIQEINDEKGNLTEFWVTWQPVKDLQLSGEHQRHYEIDRVSGEVLFGNGIHGKILPVGTDNVKVTYKAGGGTKGNLDARTIEEIKTSIPFVDKVFNPIPSGGGAGTEAIERVLERGPRLLKHRNQAITLEDFEEITFQASRAIARVKCIPNYRIDKGFMPGRVTICVLPKSSDPEPMLSLQLKEQVEEYLKQHAPGILVEKSQRIQVVGPVYMPVSVTVKLQTSAINYIPLVENTATTLLTAFFHPLTGGESSSGWDLGIIPCCSDLYSLLEAIEGVDHVESLSMKLKIPSKTQASQQIILTPGQTVDLDLPPYTLVCSGEHQITASFKTQQGGD